jgi:hypothetical protein
MIAHQDDMFSSLKNRNESFRLSGLCGLVNQDLSELYISNTPIKCCDTSCADNISVPKYFFFSKPLQLFECSFVLLIQFPLILFQLHQFLHLCELSFAQMLDLLMQREVVDIRGN